MLFAFDHVSFVFPALFSPKSLRKQLSGRLSYKFGQSVDCLVWFIFTYISSADRFVPMAVGKIAGSLRREQELEPDALVDSFLYFLQILLKTEAVRLNGIFSPKKLLIIFEFTSGKFPSGFEDVTYEAKENSITKTIHMSGIISGEKRDVSVQAKFHFRPLLTV